MRMLKPIEGTDSWQSGRRYLIAPAALAACPLSVVASLSGTICRTAAQAATTTMSESTSESSTSTLKMRTTAFGTIDLGDALITYVGEKHHLSLGKWSSCRLVLRQNYLLEYDASTPILSGLPRGFCHLECAQAYAHEDFADALELQFFASPCAKADQRVVRKIKCRFVSFWLLWVEGHEYNSAHFFPYSLSFFFAACVSANDSGQESRRSRSLDYLFERCGATWNI
jgi:hypothetical protein